MGRNVSLIAGWSERALEFIYRSEQGIDTLREKVEGYYFRQNLLLI
jgi:hypothetical protein